MPFTSAIASTTAVQLLRRARPALAVAAVVCAGALAQPALAQAAPTAPADATVNATVTATADPTVTAGSLLQFQDLRAAGVVADSATLGTRGDQLLGDAGRFDEGCLGEKTMRNITGAKAYPAPGTAKAYVDGVWTSTLDKDVYVNQSVTEGKTTAASDRYVSILLDEIAAVTSCEQDPAQGHSYGPAHRVTVGSATATYFYDHLSDGSVDGGGVAVLRDGNRVGFVALMFGAENSTATLKKLSTSAAANLR